MRLFVDTNVVLDVLLRREPFLEHSARIVTLAETAQVAGYVSALSFPNVFYLLRRNKGQQAARKAMSGMRDIFSIVPLDSQITNQAIDSDIKDFEDAIQFFSALRVGADSLITRNSRDFPSGDVSIQTPAEFLASHF
ncbi:MAG: PIN domain-containing protein [bacterium]|nr:PIN domain-containing protein [bacterium]